MTKKSLWKAKQSLQNWRKWYTKLLKVKSGSEQASILYVYPNFLRNKLHSYGFEYLLFMVPSLKNNDPIFYSSK